MFFSLCFSDNYTTLTSEYATAPLAPEKRGLETGFYLSVRFVIDKLRLKSNNSYLPSWPLFDSHLLVMLMLVGGVAAAADDEVGTAETCVVVVVVVVTAPLSAAETVDAATVGAGPVTWINLMLVVAAAALLAGGADEDVVESALDEVDC